ncbi:MAG TPA: hypothetical protein VGL83_12170 [Stellaceae bacterium]|jgi:hypothetical protein
MPFLGRRAAEIAAAAAIAATVSACAVPSPGGPAATAQDPTPFLWPDQAHAGGGALDIKDLAGLKPADIVSILGQPDLKRIEPPAELWQYRAADCVLNLFFYGDAGGYHLAHVETWQRTLGGGSAPAPCLDQDAPIKAHLVSRSSL